MVTSMPLNYTPPSCIHIIIMNLIMCIIYVLYVYIYLLNSILFNSYHPVFHFIGSCQKRGTQVDRYIDRCSWILITLNECSPAFPSERSAFVKNIKRFPFITSEPFDFTTSAILYFVYKYIFI